MTRVPAPHPDRIERDDPRIAQAAAGDRDAARSLVRELMPRVRNLVRYLAKGDSDTDDMAQDALVTVLRDLRSYRGDGPFEAWCDRVVARLTIARLRRGRRQGALLATGERPDLIPIAAAAAGEHYFERRLVVRALDALPVEQQQAMVLHHVLGLSVDEVAAEVGAPSETVRSRLRLGKEKMRERLDPDESRGEP
jgi:RNA polymerase sigma-70 factor (ECF subfamily)